MAEKLPKSVLLLQTKYTPRGDSVSRALKPTRTALNNVNNKFMSGAQLIGSCGTPIEIETGNKAGRQLNNFGEDEKMKKNILRGWIPTTGLVLAMALNTFANGGIIIPTFTSSDIKARCVSVDSGIIIPTFASSIVGILVSDFGGIIIPTLAGKTTDGCDSKN